MVLMHSIIFAASVLLWNISMLMEICWVSFKFQIFVVQLSLRFKENWTKATVNSHFDPPHEAEQSGRCCKLEHFCSFWWWDEQPGLTPDMAGEQGYSFQVDCPACKPDQSTLTLGCLHNWVKICSNLIRKYLIFKL